MIKEIKLFNKMLTYFILLCNIYITLFNLYFEKHLFSIYFHIII